MVSMCLNARALSGADGEHPMQHRRIAIALLFLITIGAGARRSSGQLPVSGQPVPELQIFDDAMQAFMDYHGIQAGVLGVMKDGRIIYLRGFGWRDKAHTTVLPENAMMRLASVTKPVTAAGIRRLIDWGTFDLHDYVFALGQASPPGPGLLVYPAFPEVREDLIEIITVDHCLRHRGGWNREPDDVPDLTYMEIAIASDMGISSPPGRVNTVRWIMGQGLQFFPGTERHYSNIGYLLLGLILEQESGMDYISFIRRYVLTESMWFPETEFELGRTFPADRNPREPWYDDDVLAISVFDPWSFPPTWVRRPDGSWDHEARTGQGALIASAVPMLNYLETYTANGINIGVPLTGRIHEDHGGSLKGTNVVAQQRTDGINFVLLINKRNPDSDGIPYSVQFRDGFNDFLDIAYATWAWPTEAVDGTWFEFGYGGTEEGSYDRPYDSPSDLTQAKVPPYSKVRIKDGSIAWAGVIDLPNVLLMAPEGATAVIGY